MPLRAPSKDYSGRSRTDRAWIGRGIIASVREEQAALEQLGRWIIFRNPSALPVGRRTIPVQPASQTVSDVVSGTAGRGGADVLPAIDRRDQPSNEGVIPQIMEPFKTASKTTYEQLKAAGYPVVWVGGDTTYAGPEFVSPAPGTGVFLPPSTGTGKNDMDLGTLATDLLKQAGTAWIQRELGPRPVSYSPALDVPVIPNVIEQYAPWYTDPVTGQLKQRCKRRRRKPIVTPSEISQLASLKAVASPAEVKLFLAKRLRT